MEDPRDVKSQDELTADEDEELINLQKEYELKVEALRVKKEKISDESRFLEKFNSVKPVMKIDYDQRIFEFKPNTPTSKRVDETEILSNEVIRIRNHSHQTIMNLASGIKILNVRRTLAKITKPDYKEPNYNNWAMIGFVTSKSEILKTAKNEKYLKLRFGNFSHSVTINLFGEAYEKYWKLRIGDLILVLNPSIYKHPKGFDFYLSEPLNNILVIGIIKNIAKCGEEKCSNYIDPIHKYCEFHETKQETKFLKNKRMELNGSVQLFNPKQKQQQYLSELNEQSNIYELKSNFNKERFIDENVFNKAGSKRKLQDQRTNRKLEDKLLKLANTSRYESLGLVKTSKAQTIRKEYENSKGGAKPDLKNELKSLARDKPQINLGMSTSDKKAKLDRWSKNMKILKSHNNSKAKVSDAKNREVRVVKSARSGHNAHEIRHTPIPIPQSSNSSDDDLDIIVSKSNHEQVKQYEKYKRLNTGVNK